MGQTGNQNVVEKRNSDDTTGLNRGRPTLSSHIIDGPMGT
jgi:hypothetical protein